MKYEDDYKDSTHSLVYHEAAKRFGHGTFRVVQVNNEYFVEVQENMKTTMYKATFLPNEPPGKQILLVMTTK